MEEWLFDENLGYAETLARAQKEFGIAASMSSVGRYYRSRSVEREVAGLLDAQIAANALNDLPVNTNDLRSAVVKLIGKAALKLANEKPDQLEQLVFLTKLLIDSEDTDIRRARVKLAERYFHFEATAASAKEFPQMRAYLDAIGSDTALSQDEKIKRVHAILYGWDRSKPDGIEPDKSRNGNS